MFFGRTPMAAIEQHETSAGQEAEELPVGTVLLRGSYKVTRFIASGGFGKTYLATDNLDRSVVIKECFPSAFCCRSGENVVPMSRACEGEFRTLVDLFKAEARNLSKLSHPNIVEVHQVFDDNNTAYMVLDHVEGRDLGTALSEHDKRLTPDVIQIIADKLLDAVATIHKADVLHRDISPDNILLTQENEPILIDFGAARQVAVATSRKLSAMRTVKDGYSPQEFYSNGDGSHYASDLYSLAATLHHAIVGYAPPVAQERVAAVGSGLRDPYLPIALQARGYDRGLLEAIDRALSLFPVDRPQTVKEWRQLQKGQRIPNRSGRKRQDSSVEMIKQIMGVDSGVPDEAEVLRSLRITDEAPPSTIASPKKTLVASAAILGVTVAVGLVLTLLGGTPEVAPDVPVAEAQSFSDDAVALSDGTVLGPQTTGDATLTRVASIAPGSGTQFRRGDILVALMPERTGITNPESFDALLKAAREAGRETVTVAVRRNGSVYTVTLNISEQHSDLNK